MDKGIEIGVAVDGRAAKRGIETGLIEPMEDAEKALNDLGKAKGLDQLEDGLQDAQTATKRLEKETKDAADTIEKEYRRSYAALKNNSNDATARGKANVQELGNEAKQNLAETLASFDGTVEGTLSGIQGTLGGVTAGLTGVIPIIAAAAGAAGLGLIAVAFQKNGEEAQRVRDQINALAADFIETGGVAESSIAFIVDRLKELATGTEEGQTSLKELAKAADRSGSSFKDLAQAYAGNTAGLTELVKENDKYLDSLYEEQSQLDVTTNAGVARQKVLTGLITGQEEYNTFLGQAKTVADEAAKAEAYLARSGAADLAIKEGLIAAVDAAYDNAAGAVADYLNKETGLFDTGAYITAMQAKEDALRNYQDTLASSALSPEAKTFLNEQGQESAAQFLAGYKAATPAQKTELNRIWTESGKTSSGTFTGELGKGISAYKVPKVDVPLKVDDSALRNYTPPRLTVKVDYVDSRTGKPIGR